MSFLDDDFRNDWYKLDNVAKLFLATYNKRDTRAIRVSATLKEDIDPVLLQEAVDEMIKLRPQFQVRIRRGVFWNYLENTDAKPVVVEEYQRPCPLLYGPSYHGVLHYQISYFGRRINIDMFHALADGTGALNLLQVLLQCYLKLTHPEMEHAVVGGSASAADRNRNSYEQFYDHATGRIPKKILNKKSKAYRIQGRKLPYDQLQFFEVHTSAKALQKRAKEIGSGMTAYLGAQLMMAIHMDRSFTQKKKAITISMPVNLRNYYPSETMRNFFNSVDVSHVFTGEETVESLAAEFDRELKESLKLENIQKQMNHFQSIERLFFTRMVPLAIKQPVIRSFAEKDSKTVTAVLSNLGRVELPEQVAPYVEKVTDFCSTDKMFITVTSYGDDLCFGVSSAYGSTSVLRHFVNRLQDDGAEFTIYASEVIR